MFQFIIFILSSLTVFNFSAYIAFPTSLIKSMHVAHEEYSFPKQHVLFLHQNQISWVNLNLTPG